MKNGDTKSVSDALKMFGDQNSAAKWFGHLNTKSDGSSIISDRRLLMNLAQERKIYSSSEKFEKVLLEL